MKQVFGYEAKTKASGTLIYKEEHHQLCTSTEGVTSIGDETFAI